MLAAEASVEAEGPVVADPGAMSLTVLAWDSALAAIELTLHLGLSAGVKSRSLNVEDSSLKLIQESKISEQHQMGP